MTTSRARASPAEASRTSTVATGASGGPSASRAHRSAERAEARGETAREVGRGVERGGGRSPPRRRRGLRGRGGLGEERPVGGADGDLAAGEGGEARCPLLAEREAAGEPERRVARHGRPGDDGEHRLHALGRGARHDARRGAPGRRREERRDVGVDVAGAARQVARRDDAAVRLRDREHVEPARLHPLARANRRVGGRDRAAREVARERLGVRPAREPLDQRKGKRNGTVFSSMQG